jgi:hypothetical protein
LQIAMEQMTRGSDAHSQLLAADIKRFLERPTTPMTRMALPVAPPGAPIGDTGMNWLWRLDPPCSWMER